MKDKVWSKKLNKKVTAFRQAEEAALKHQIKTLGFKDFGDYKNWCLQNGFSTRMDKTNAQFAAEVQFQRKQVSIVRSVNESKQPNIKRMLKNFSNSLSKPISWTGTDKPVELPDDYRRLSVIRDVYQSVNETKKKQIVKFFNTLITYANLLEEVSDQKRFINLLVDIIKLEHLCVRPLDGWKCRSHNTYRQFTSLLRHAFVLYEMPAFMDRAWVKSVATLTTDNATNERDWNAARVAAPVTPSSKYTKYRSWYLHLGKGLNARNLPDLPIPFTKRMAHFFMKAPENYEPNDAVRYGQVLALGGNPFLVDALRPTRVCNQFDNEEFWESVIRWFIAQPMFDYSQHVGPIIDFVSNQKFTPRNVIENGVVTHMGAPQPGFSMKGRDPEALLRQVEAWHNQLGREKKSGNLTWEHQKNIADFEFIEGVDGTKSRKVWTIKELCSSGQLQEEGRKMRHCVSSYSHSCSTGKISIWSMDKLDSTGKERQLTIQVNSGGNIAQIRGRFNVKATEQQMIVIRRWATQNKLNFGYYL